MEEKDLIEYKGKSIELLNRDELLEALRTAVGHIQQLHDSLERNYRLMELFRQR